jgi:cation diffusion facilitator family transporter
MDECCEAKATEVAHLRQRQGRVLVLVLAVNLAMFAIEVIGGLIAGSTALLADSLDMLGDAFVYGFSLYVLHRSLAWRARAALAKGLIMAAFGVGVLIDAAFRLRAGVPPLAPAMFAIGSIALLANTFCFALLWRHRADDLNLRSTWLCSRNDLVANGAVLVAALLVAWSRSVWPDVLIGTGIALLFLRTAATVIRESLTAIGRQGFSPSAADAA